MKPSLLLLSLLLMTACNRKPAAGTITDTLVRQPEVETQLPPAFVPDRTQVALPDDPALAPRLAASWLYQAITDSAGNTIKPVGPVDCMTLNIPKGTFRYDLGPANIHARGKARLQQGTLHFAYADTAGKPTGVHRRFRVWSLTDSSLVFREDSTRMFFHYRRQAGNCP